MSRQLNPGDKGACLDVVWFWCTPMQRITVN